MFKGCDDVAEARSGGAKRVQVGAHVMAASLRRSQLVEGWLSRVRVSPIAGRA